jgi:hypothetical protein
MKRSTWRLGVAALLLFGGVTGTFAEERGKDTDNFKVLPIQKYLVMMAKSSSTICDAEAHPNCIIDMRLISVGDRNYCLAVAQDVNIKTHRGGGANKKNIVWKLSVANLGGKALRFHADSGILITVDADGQVDPKGGYGDGSSGSGPQPTDIYYVKTKRDTPNANSGYLPVILWGPAGQEELCTAVDPKIVNVN